MKDPVQHSSPTPDNAPARHRRPRRARRTVYVVTGAVAVLGLGIGGVVATTAPSDPTPAAVDLGVAARADDAARADRSAREPVTPSAVPASPSPSPSAASPAPKKTATAKPKPKPKKKTVAKKPTWVIPMKGADITSCYGPRWGTQHAGIDFAMPAGTPIHAAAAGTVVKAGDVGDGYGISVFIDHHNGYLTHYAHQSRLAVGVGDTVKAGQVIGYEGSTGDSTGPHLHFEVHQGAMWNQIDPAPFLRARGVDVAC
ncbi:MULTISPECIES: M23 family metallopeptidase [unclassified Micromonospora]|uniref:M23 family metallopeptidase n=1 Tax=unclassified Micromonospora TaxID=2617518 RepID=UPI001C23550B|nr:MULTISPECIES: M23 family metallopeptidase [unclassified Micromonospora]MBU8857009.1 M23 family metallopeptidase [Micromonospora sp. WMMB482]MDM4782629.1 M23 family metallopeptidase [Micromonospora sp. b486]